MVDVVRVALLGCGTVGTETARLLLTHTEELAARVGAPVELVGIAERAVDVERDPAIPHELITTDWQGLVRRADIVIELIGGAEPARTMILEAMAHGASVVTANKALLGQDGPTLYAAAEAAGVDLYYEAAVGGAIPLIRPVRESLAGDRVTRILGIVNGTTNYVLDQMATTGDDLTLAVKQAQVRGYAEADPTADVQGHDAAAKAAILASLAFHTRVSTADVHCEGITGITADDVAWAAETGHVIKLLAIAERTPVDADGNEGIVARVHPALVPAEHPLAGVRGVFNAVFVEAEAAGQLMFYGQGAGGVPTASAVCGDVVTIARHLVHGGRGPRESRYAELPRARHRRRRHALPGAAARRRPSGRARPGRAGVRRARRLDRDGAAVGRAGRARGPPGRHACGPRGRTGGDRHVVGEPRAGRGRPVGASSRRSVGGQAVAWGDRRVR